MLFRSAHGMDLLTALGTMCTDQMTDQHIDVFMVARMVGARGKIELTAAAPEVRQGQMPLVGLRPSSHGASVMAVTTAFQAMKQHQQRGCWICCRQVIDVDEILVCRGDALALPSGGLFQSISCPLAGPDGLCVAARQPPGSTGRDHQCKVVGALTMSVTSAWVPGLAWWATMRQPCAVR